MHDGGQSGRIPCGDDAQLRDARPWQRPRTLRLLALSVLAGLLVVVVAGVAGAASGSVSSAASSAGSASSAFSFCQLAASYSKSKFNPTAKPLAPSQLKLEYSRLKSEEKTILPITPSAIKPDFQKLFAFDNTYFNELAKYKYVVSKVPRSFYLGLEKQAATLKPASNAINAYLHTKCKIKTR